jgi:hypothetical protein
MCWSVNCKDSEIKLCMRKNHAPKVAASKYYEWETKVVFVLGSWQRPTNLKAWYHCGKEQYPLTHKRKLVTMGSGQFLLSLFFPFIYYYCHIRDMQIARGRRWTTCTIICENRNTTGSARTWRRQSVLQYHNNTIMPAVKYRQEIWIRNRRRAQVERDIEFVQAGVEGGLRLNLFLRHTHWPTLDSREIPAQLCPSFCSSTLHALTWDYQIYTYVRPNTWDYNSKSHY